MKLQALRNYAEDEKNVVKKEQKIINIKSPEMYFAKLLALYEHPFKMAITKEEYPRWAFEYELQQMKEICPDGNQPLRTVPEVNSKKLLKFLQQAKLSDRWVQLVPLDGGHKMARWKTMIDYGITRD